ncbi:hypothetical protein EXIGLDRAFT_571209, partial [Exidia glandulosa HHB12029]
LHASGMPRYLWGECVLHCAEVLNRLGTRAFDGLSPFEKKLKHAPNIKGWPEWG